MMVSQVRYPSFKSLNLRATRTFTKTLVAILFVGCVIVFREKILVFILPLFFTAYLIYGFVRPRISRAMRREIEDEDEDEPDTAAINHAGLPVHFTFRPDGLHQRPAASMPVGPVNLTIINEGARRGFKWAVLIGLGAATMDLIYCTIAFTGFSSFFKVRIVKTSMEVFTFVFMLFLGINFSPPKR